MEVRRATFEDFDSMIAMGVRGHAMSEHSQYKFDEDEARLLLAQCISAKQLCSFVCVSEGRLVGMLLGQEQKYPYLKMKFATDIALYTEAPGAGRLLLKRFEKWGLGERKVDEMLLGTSFSADRAPAVASMYKRMGYTPVGGIFTKHRELP